MQPVVRSQRGSGLTQPLRDTTVVVGSSVNRQSFSSFTASSGTTAGSRRFTFALGSTRITNSWLTPRRAALHISDQVLAQQQPRVRILNWLSTLGAPCGGCLPVIIVYQSLGADVWWALMWPLCWVAPAILMFPLSRALESRGRYGGTSAMTNGATALCYIAVYGSITAAILVGLVVKAQAGGFKEFDVKFPASTFISTTLGTMAITLSYLESSILADATKEHIGAHFLGSVVIGSSTRASTLDESETGDDAAEDIPAEERPGDAVTTRIGVCVRPILRFLLEYDEQMDPQRFGRRLPSRRLSLMVGLGLCSWVLAETYHESEGFKDQYVLKNVKELLASLDTGLQWPEGNATVLDEAFEVYGDCCKAEFMLQCCAVALLVCACWCDIVVRDYHGLQASRVFGFVGLAVMFCSSLVPAGPNYLRISKMDTITPCCAPKFNFAITTLLQDLVGIACSGLFAFRLLPVLLIVVPSMVRACTLLLMDDIRRCNQDVKAGSLELILANYADPAFSRSNVHSVLALCSMLTPLFTAIPMTVIFQFLRRYDQGSLLTVMISIFYAVPIFLGMLQCDTIKRAELRYLAWMLGYFGPLLVMVLYEADQFGFMDQVKEQLLNPLTYAEIMAEIFIANVILSDIMYSNLYVERRQPKDQAGSEAAGGGGRSLQTLREAQTSRADSDDDPAGGGGVSRASSRSSGAEAPVLDGYDQVLRDANLESFMFIPGFDSLEALRRGKRDDLIQSGLDTAQAAAVFAALGRYDAAQLQAQQQPISRPASPQLPDQTGGGTTAEEASRVDVRKSQRSAGVKLVLLVLCPLLLLTCGVLSSLQALRYIDSFPFVSRLLGLVAPHPIGAETLAPPPVADNGHPCPWEP